MARKNRCGYHLPLFRTALGRIHQQRDGHSLTMVQDSTSSNDSFHETMDRLRSRGSDGALERVIDRFQSRLRLLADRKLVDAGVRARVDPEDVLQSVFQTFWKRCKLDEGQRWEFSEWDDLWRLLVTFTLRRCRRRIRAHRGANRSVQREQHGDSDLPAGQAAIEPGPHETAEFADLTDTLLERLSPREQWVILRLLEGYSRQEISEEQNCSYRTISRRLGRAEDVLRQLIDDEPGEDA